MNRSASDTFMRCVEVRGPMEKKKAPKKATGPAKKAAKKAARPRPRADAPDGEGSQLITQRIQELGDWRGEMLAKMRALILDADPDVVEEVKWRKPSNPAGVPVWSHDGMICTGETYKEAVKLTFAQGAKLKDPARLFNASLDAGTRRAIDIREGDRVDEQAFRTLIRDAVALNVGKSR